MRGEENMATTQKFNAALSPGEMEVEIAESRVSSKDLLPTLAKNRILDPVSYAFSWIAAVININSFMMGAALVPPTGVLNLVQACIAMVCGVSMMAVLMTLNGEPGHKYGFPFVIHARPSYGIAGALFPGLIRAVPAILWYGIQTWIGAEAVNTVFGVMFGYDNIAVCFVGFLMLQIALSCMGFKGIKWLENFGAIFIIIALSIMFVVIYGQYKADIVVKLIQYEGDWGWPLLVGICTFGGTYATYAITMSDIIRELHTDVKRRTTFILHWIGTLPFTMFMAVIGLLCSGTTGSWDPIEVFTRVMPNKPLLIMTLLFIAFAQITTNVLINVVPASYIVMQYTKLRYRPACLVISILAGCCMPWKLTTGTGFTMFVRVVSAFLIPFAVVMIVDYYVLRRRHYDVEMMYDPQGPYAGINWNGIIAACVGAAVALAFVEISWLASIIPTVLSYILLSKYGPLSRQFLAGSIWESQKQ